jgi:hypothetical protein
MGMRKARVLPLPVRAEPRTSFPLRDTGRLFAWISVMSTKNAFLSPACVDGQNRQLQGRKIIPRFVCSDMGNSEKVLSPSGATYVKSGSVHPPDDGGFTHIFMHLLFQSFNSMLLRYLLRLCWFDNTLGRLFRPSRTPD